RDLDRMVRLTAAGLCADDEGLEVMRQLAMTPGPGKSLAVALLSERWPWERVCSIVAGALQQPDELTRVAALRAIGAKREAGLLPKVCALAGGENEAVARATAAALAELGKPEGERALIQLLSHRATEVQLAAAKALAGLGTPAAVEPLLPLTR